MEDPSKIRDAIRVLDSLKTALESMLREKASGPPPERNPEIFSKLVRKDAWPTAVEGRLICNPDSDASRHRRSLKLLDRLLDRDVAGRKMLHFLCGPGDVVYAGHSLDAKLSAGYDVSRLGWSRFPASNSLLFGTDPDEMRESGPYDIVALTECLEWQEDPIGVLSSAASMLSPDGLIHARCLPWTSRLGMGSANAIAFNRAFSHLFLTGDEMRAVGYDSLPVHRILSPVEYERWFSAAGLVVRGCRSERVTVEKVFGSPLCRERLAETCPGLDAGSLSVTHLNYTLRKKA